MHELNISECYRITGRRVRASFSFSGSFQLLFPLAFFKDQNAVIVRGREDDEAESESSVATRMNWTDWIEEKLTQAWIAPIFKRNFRVGRRSSVRMMAEPRSGCW